MKDVPSSMRKSPQYFSGGTSSILRRYFKVISDVYKGKPGQHFPGKSYDKRFWPDLSIINENFFGPIKVAIGLVFVKGSR